MTLRHQKTSPTAITDFKRGWVILVVATYKYEAYKYEAEVSSSSRTRTTQPSLMSDLHTQQSQPGVSAIHYDDAGNPYYRDRDGQWKPYNFNNPQVDPSAYSNSRDGPNPPVSQALFMVSFANVLYCC